MPCSSYLRVLCTLCISLICSLTANSEEGLIPKHTGLECVTSKDASTLSLNFSGYKIQLKAANGWTQHGADSDTGYSSYGSVSVSGSGSQADIDLIGEFQILQDCSFIAQLTSLPSAAGSFITNITAGTTGTTASPHISLALASGKEIMQQAKDDGWSFKVGFQEDRPYFWFQYLNRMEMGIGNYTIKLDKWPSKNKSRVVIDPFDPMFYMEGDFLGGSVMKQMTGGTFKEKQWFGKGEGSNDSVGIGVSLSGLLVLHPVNTASNSG